ncbi:MAG: glycosyltransferase, partial [Thermoanaerobaculia bacterium]
MSAISPKQPASAPKRSGEDPSVTPAVDVLVVIVAWNSASYLGEAVRSIPAGTPVVVVDNASTDRSAEIAEAAGARVVRLPSNIGFGPACNRGAREQGGTSRTIFFLNPDAALRGGAAALHRLLSA